MVRFDCGKRLVLASGSPRRRELLHMIADRFTVEPVDVDESYSPDMDAMEVAEYLSLKKAAAFNTAHAHERGEYLAITSDTVVVLDGHVLGKPHSELEAVRMLKALSGRVHRVVSGVALTDGIRTVAERAVTEVEFAPLTGDEIESYVDICRPLDKAGAYGIQEWIGAIGVKGINGSFYNVMGLPVHVLYNMLKQFTATRIPSADGDRSISD